MSDKDLLVVLGASYDSKEAAEADYEAVKAMYKEAGVGHAFDAAVLERGADGKVKVADKHEASTRHDAWVGLAIGAVAAILPGIGLGVGAAVGAGVGAVTGHLKGGMSNDDLKELGTVLDDGRSRTDRDLCDEHGRPDRRQHQGAEPVRLEGDRRGRRRAGQAAEGGRRRMTVATHRTPTARRVFQADVSARTTPLVLVVLLMAAAGCSGDDDGGGGSSSSGGSNRLYRGRRPQGFRHRAHRGEPGQRRPRRAEVGCYRGPNRPGRYGVGGLVRTPALRRRGEVRRSTICSRHSEASRMRADSGRQRRRSARSSRSWAPR